MRHNRFSFTKTHKTPINKPLLSVGLFVVLIFLFVSGLGSISSDSKKRQLESLENALSRNILHYYSMEGQYPQSLEILRQSYGLTYNQDFFYVDYRFLGDNIYPDITILQEEQ